MLERVVAYLRSEIKELCKKRKIYVNKHWSAEWVDFGDLTTYLSKMEKNHWNLYRIGEVKDGTCDVVFYKYEVIEEWEWE